MSVVLLLTYRYLILLLQEGSRMSAAYALRAPYSKGIAFTLGVRWWDSCFCAA